MRLSEYLQKEKISAAEFGRRIGLSRSGVLRLCNGERKPSAQVLMDIVAQTEGKVTLTDFAAHWAEASGSAA